MSRSEKVLAAKSGKVAAGKQDKPPARRPGRPQTGQGGNISRQSILKAALKLSKTVPLQDLSIVTVAKAMQVTPALIHYYVGGREWLTSGTMNLFYKELIRKWPVKTGDWKADLEAAAYVIYNQFSNFGGVAAYAVSNSRFRVFQLTAFGDRDFGVEMLDRFAGQVRAAGLSGDRTGIYSHLFLEFIITTGHGASHHIYPKEHQEFLQDKLSKLDVEKYPNVLFSGGGPAMLDGGAAFAEGCRLFILGIEAEAGEGARRTASSPVSRKRKSGSQSGL